MIPLPAREADLGSDAHPPFAHPDRVDRPLAAFVLDHARARPDAIAVVDDAGETSYAALVAMAARIAEQLARIAPGKAPVGILMPVSAPYIAAILALLARGTPYVPLDTGYPDAANARIAARAGLAALLVDEASADAARRIAPDVPRIRVAACDGAAAVPLEVTAQPDDVAILFFTSGSTGEPKGVCQNQRTTAYEVLRHCWRVGLRRDDGVALLYSPAAAGSTRDIQGSLLAGARLCIVDVRRQGAGAAMRWLADWGATVFHAMPGLFRTVFGEDHPDSARLTRSVRLVHLISDRVLTSDVALWQRRFPRGSRLYIDIAATELSASSYASWVLDHDTVIDRDLVPVGYPRADMVLTLVDAQGQAVPPGELGEIIVSAPSLAQGYWNDEAATARVFSPSTRLAGARDYRTGDLGRMLPGGLLEFVGRRDRQVKLRGYTVHLAEVEAGLARCPGVVEAGALLRQQGADAVLVAYCVPARGATIDPEGVSAWCRAHLSPGMWPHRIVLIDALPRLPNGKPDAQGLAALDRASAPPAAMALPPEQGAPLSPVARAVGDAWARLLSAASLSADLPFEAAGGDSLKAMNLMLLLEQRLGVAIAPDSLDLRTRPSELIARLERPRSGDEAVGGSGLPLLYLFPGIFGADLDAADFARRMAGRFAVTLVDYRWGGDDLAGSFSGERLIGAICDRIRNALPARIWLVGHSFGGKLAVEVARRLHDAGIAVDTILILDGVPTDDRLRSRETIERIEPARARVRRGIASEGAFGFLRDRMHKRGVWLAGAAARALVARRHYRAARMVLALLDNRWLHDAHLTARRWMIAKTRSLAFADLPVASRLDAALILLVSSEQRYPPALYPDLGWAPYFARIEAIRVDIRHADFFAAGANDALVRWIDERLAKAVATPDW